MTMSSLEPSEPKGDPPAGWEVLLKLLGDWGIVLRFALILIILVVAAVTIVALLVPIDLAALIAYARDHYGIKQLMAWWCHRGDGA
ncbi:MAG: hypothetical protein ACRDTC_22420 [Pseudonocardiaceae bacterium]